MSALERACRRCATPVEQADLRCCICAFAVEQDGSTGPAAVERVAILRCGECAAAVSYLAEAQAPKCAFCGSVMNVEAPVDPVEQAELILPFTVDRSTAAASMRRWLRSLGWFRPSDLSSSATVESLRPLHWSAWIFDADAMVTWTADSNHDSHRSRWAPQSGKTGFTWRNILVSASRGLSNKESIRLADGFRLETAAPFAAAPAEEEHAIEAFDVQRSAARRKIVETIEGIAAQQLVGGHIPGSDFRNVRVAVLLERLRTRRFVLPTWVLAYRYRGRLYRSLVHGQDDAIAFGDAPYSWSKIFLVIAIVIAVVFGAIAFAVS